MAITEFCPGSQKTKDKKIITSIGFSPAPMKHSVRHEANNHHIKEISAGIQNSPTFTLSKLLIRCRKCGYFKTENVNDDNLEIIACPQCACVDEKVFENTEIRTPAAFRTDFSPGEDSTEDTDIFFMRPSVLAENVVDLIPEILTHTNSKVSIARNDLTWRINDTEITGRICNTKNKFEFTNNWEYNIDEQWIVEDKIGTQINRGDYSFRAIGRENPLQTIKLAASKVTNVFRIMPNEIPKGLNLNPFDPDAQGVRAAYYSAAFILQRALAEKLDIDPTEIEVADIARRSTINNEWVGEITLADEAANGSGFVEDLNKNLIHGHNFFEKILNPEKESTFFGSILSTDHRKCKSACYKCLQVYRNMPYHGLLDWRLGISLLRVMYDKDYSAGADGVFETPELTDWMEDARLLRNNFFESFFGQYGEVFEMIDDQVEDNTPPMIYNCNANRMYIIVNPLWNRHIPSDNIIGQAVAVAAQKGVIKDDCIFIDTFNLVRRPGWCYEKIIQ